MLPEHRVARALYAAILLAALTSPSHADEGPPPSAPTAKASAALVEGRRLFTEAAAWVANGRADLARIRDVFVDLPDVSLALDRRNLDGHLRFWLQSPARFRLEQRATNTDRPTVKILDGERMWIGTVDGSRKRTWHKKHGTPNGHLAIAQLKKDRGRFANLARFLSLGSLLGPGVVMESKGLVSILPRAPYLHLAGTWLKVQRRAPNGERMAFLFAFSKDADGTLHATSPGAVLVPGTSPAEPTEHYVLQRWRTKGERLPGKILGYTRKPKATEFTETLKAFPKTLRINAGLDASLFQPTDK